MFTQSHILDCLTNWAVLSLAIGLVLSFLWYVHQLKIWKGQAQRWEDQYCQLEDRCRKLWPNALNMDETPQALPSWMSSLIEQSEIQNWVVADCTYRFYQDDEIHTFMLELNPSGTIRLQIAPKFNRMDDLEPNWVWTKTFHSYAEGQALHRKLLMKEDLTYLQQFEQVFTVFHDSPTRSVERLDLQDATKQDIIL